MLLFSLLHVFRSNDDDDDDDDDDDEPFTVEYACLWVVVVVVVDGDDVLGLAWASLSVSGVTVLMVVVIGLVAVDTTTLISMISSSIS